MKRLQQEYGIALILLSMGKNGSAAYCGGQKAVVPAFINETQLKQQEQEIHLWGCMLDRILEKGYQNLQKCDLEAMLQFANAAASIITTRRGALRVMPEREEIVRLISYIN